MRFLLILISLCPEAARELDKLANSVEDIRKGSTPTREFSGKIDMSQSA